MMPFNRQAVVGAAGKMGSGISLLLLQEIAKLEASTTGKVGSGRYALTLIDSSAEALPGLRTYLRMQMRRFAEKQINALREYYQHNPSLASNEEIIDAFVQGALDCVRFEGELSQAKDARLIFEAIVEDLDVKTSVFSELRPLTSPHSLFFTNTSSLPIGVLAKACGLEGRLIGYHFYNPPAVQRLLEIIPAEGNADAFIRLAKELAERLGKIAVISKDVAGFIGNGHFLREINESLKEVKELQLAYSQVEAICIVDQMTRELLIRPMGIFQLFDYVGIDVLHRVMKIMTRYLSIQFHGELIEQMMQSGKLGGQYSDGSQKDGFFQYNQGKMVKVFSLDQNRYVDLPKDLLGPLPKGHLPWKALNKQKNRDELLSAYFENLFKMDAPKAQLAVNHLHACQKIARGLVADGVAQTLEDVNTVMINGFYHLYGPDSRLFPKEILR